MIIAGTRRKFRDGLLDKSYLHGGETSTETEIHVSREKGAWVFILGRDVTVG